MMSQIADRYAKALFETAKETTVLEAVENAMIGIKNIIIESNDFRLFLSNPILSLEERCVILKALFEGKIPELGLKFLLFITHKRRLDILENIIESFDHLTMTDTGCLRACVTTALPMEEVDKAVIDQRLRDKFRLKILTEWKIDPLLIGGFRIFLQDKIYDYSFKNQLNNFYQQTT